jgi:hypothetical protein
MKMRCVAASNGIIQPIGKAILFSADWMPTLIPRSQPFDFESVDCGFESRRGARC